MKPERWTICPLCNRVAESSRALTGLGCEGRHVDVVEASAYEQLEKQLHEETQRTILWRKDCERLEEELGEVEREADEESALRAKGEGQLRAELKALRAAVEAEVERLGKEAKDCEAWGRTTPEEADAFNAEAGGYKRAASRLSSILEGKSKKLGAGLPEPGCLKTYRPDCTESQEEKP